jgi:hypothetical protein
MYFGLVVQSSIVMADSDTAPGKFQRPASQATSVKAEPGSALGSVASASVKRVCMYIVCM